MITNYECYKIYSSLIKKGFLETLPKNGLAQKDSQPTFEFRQLYRRFGRKKRSLGQFKIIRKKDLERTLHFEKLENPISVYTLIETGVFFYESGFYWITPDGVKGWGTIRGQISHIANTGAYPRGYPVSESVRRKFEGKVQENFFEIEECEGSIRRFPFKPKPRKEIRIEGNGKMEAIDLFEE